MTQVNQQGNAWNGTVTGANGTSAAIQLNNCRLVTVLGHVSGATTLTAEWSADGINWYDSGTTNGPTGAQDVGFSFDAAANWVRLKSSSSVTATLTIAGS